MNMRTLILIAVLLATRIVHAAPRVTPEAAEAARLFETGSRAYTLGEYKDAIDKYKAAYKLQAEPALLYDIAQAYRLDGDFEHALKFYRSYLYMDPDTEHRVTVEARIKEVEAIVAQQKASQARPPNGPVALPTATKTLFLPTIYGHAPSMPAKRSATRRLHWIAFGASVLAVATGAYLWQIDNRGTCTPSQPGAECPRLYDTKAAGITLLALGSVGAVTTYVWRF